MNTDVFYTIVFLIEFLFLLFLSRQTTKLLSHIFLRLTKNHHASIKLLAILFLPGVCIHEFAHYMTARILGVHAGHMEFFPQVRENYVKLGSVSIAETDPIRRFLIGVAPVLFGIGVISYLLGLYFSPLFAPFIFWKSLFVIYGIFEISTTMFSSGKDLEGSLILCVILLLLFMTFWFVDTNNLRHVLFFLHILRPFIEQSVRTFLFVLAIDITMFIAGRIFAQTIR